MEQGSGLECGDTVKFDSSRQKNPKIGEANMKRFEEAFIGVQVDFGASNDDDQSMEVLFKKQRALYTAIEIEFEKVAHEDFGVKDPTISDDFVDCPISLCDDDAEMAFSKGHATSFFYFHSDQDVCPELLQKLGALVERVCSETAPGTKQTGKFEVQKAWRVTETEIVDLPSTNRKSKP